VGVIIDYAYPQERVADSSINPVWISI